MIDHRPQAIVISKKVADAGKPINSFSPWYQMPAKIDDVGKPFNIASYALLTLMVAQVTGLKPGDFVHTLGDAHIYANHFEQAELQMTRTPKPLPTMRINPEVRDLFSFKFEDFTLENYEADSSIKAPIAV